VRQAEIVDAARAYTYSQMLAQNISSLSAIARWVVAEKSRGKQSRAQRDHALANA
jgi:hypothetical protein